jgi:hypothetical protein|tara:strand:- start:350 stop:694 length:345 start_codon:yes stop_codon:yes gene_type:complete
VPTFQTLPTIVSGDTYTATLTFTKDGASYNTSAHTVTFSLVDGEHPETKHVTDHAVTEGATNTLTLSASETTAIRTRSDHTESLVHYGDFKTIESGGDEVHTERFWIPVRRKVT